MMKRPFRIMLHSGFWLGYLILLAIVMFAALQGQEVEPEDRGYYFSFVFGLAILPPLISFYAYYYYLFPNFLQKREVLRSVLVGALLSIGAALAGFLAIKLSSADAFQCVREGWPYASAISITLSTVLGVIALVVKGFLTWYEELKLKEELMEKTHRMELELVKSQLDPHFLFNTINNIDILIAKEPDEASRYLNKLSGIMRFMLYETKGEKIPLAKELEYIEKYVELQKIRTANPNYVHYEISGDLSEKKVAPMVFIPFIENAFKHSVNKKVDRAVDIDIQVNGQGIAFKCRNRFDPGKRPSNGQNGLGNELIQKRLELLYPGSHSLKVDRSQGLYSVELKIHNGQV